MQVTDFVASGSFASLRENVKYYKTENYALLVKTQDFANNFTKDLTFTDEHGYKFLSNSNIFGGELVLSNVGSIGKVFIVPKLNRPTTLAPNSIMVRCFDNLHAGWLYILFNSAFGLDALLSISSATAIKKFNKTGFKALLIPIPPIEEQMRIMYELKQYEPFIAEYNKLEQEKSKLDGEIYERLKKSILQYAIQGKLVPQDENDEPASELLKRIRAEKKVQLGNKYVDNYIYKGDDNCYYEHIDGKSKDESIEVPFDLPNNWSWCRLDNLALYKKGPFGSSLTKDMFVPKSETSIKVYEQKNAIYKDCTLGNYYISEQKYNTMKAFEVFANDIIVSCAGTIGETYILPNDCPKGIINQALMKITLFKQEIVEFYLLYFDYILKIQAQQSSKGSAIKNIPPFEILKNMLMPIPPIKEQNRIVDKINEIFAKL